MRGGRTAALFFGLVACSGVPADSGDKPPAVGQAGAKPLASGMASGGTTILTIPLPLLEPQEREFAVALVRQGRELHRTEWRPIFPRR